MFIYKYIHSIATRRWADIACLLIAYFPGLHPGGITGAGAGGSCGTGASEGGNNSGAVSTPVFNRVGNNKKSTGNIKKNT